MAFSPSTFLVSWMSEITKHDFREHQPHSSFTPVSRKPSGHYVTDSIPARTKQMKSWLLLQETTPKSQPVQTTRKPRKGNTRQSKPWWTTDNPGFSLTEGEHFLTYSAEDQWLGPFALHLHAPPMLCLPFTFFFFFLSQQGNTLLCCPRYYNIPPQKKFLWNVSSCLLVIVVLSSQA